MKGRGNDLGGSVTMALALQRALFPLVAALPAGEKLNIGELTRAVTPTQPDVIAAIQALIAGGRLDARTLRPRPTGAELAARLDAEAERRRLAPTAASVEAFGYESAIVVLRRGSKAVSSETLAKAEAWLAGTPPHALQETGPSPRVAGTSEAGGESTPPPASRRKVPITATGAELFRLLRDEGDRRGLTITATSREIFGNVAQLLNMKRASRPPRESTRLKAEAWLNAPPAAAQALQATQAAPIVNGNSLADELQALIDKENLSKARVGEHLFNIRNGVDTLRQSKSPRPATVERVRAFLADPPLAELRRQVQRRGPARHPSPPRQVATARSPEAASLHGHRQAAATRRGIGRQALAVLAGENLGGIKPAVRAQMAIIQANRDAEARQADPVAMAQLTLQRKNRTVYRASVCGRSAKKFVVSGCRRDVTEKELVELAAGRLTFAQFNGEG